LNHSLCAPGSRKSWTEGKPPQNQRSAIHLVPASSEERKGVSSNIVVKNIYEYYAKWIREGRLKVSSDWNKDLKIKFTVQDPCQIVRKSYGDPIAEDLRYVVKAVVGEENFIDMQPNRSK
jgi:hypothetical protein